MGEEVLLRAEGVWRVFGTHTVLREVSLTLYANEIVVIEGPSGVGKSTLLNILAGLDKPSRGTVWWRDQNLHRLPEKRLARFRNQHMGFVFQFHFLLPELTAIENVMLACLLKGESWRTCFQKAYTLLEELGIVQRARHYPGQLSGGEQQRVAIARALINQPEIVFADEPTGNLDLHQGEQIRDLFHTLKTRYRITFVIVTHNPIFRSIADRWFYLYDGQLHTQKPF